MQDEVTIQGLIMVPSKGWKSSNIWEQHQQIKTEFNLLSKNIKIKIYRNIILPVVLYGCDTWVVHNEGGT